ncbi:MAG: MFS transporter [Clostridia bacterium]|nr:MFS transporter [Clostridia bacterium]
MQSKLSKRFYAVLILFSLVGQIAWVVENMYFNVFIYKIFHASASDISLMVALSAVSATLTSILIGALSDKIGKRKIFICGGYLLWGVSILCFCLIRLDILNALFPAAVSVASIGISLVIILDCVMTFFGSSANDAAFNAWLTETTDSTNRGSAEGINSMMPLVAILVVFGGFMALDLDKSSSWTIVFLVIGLVVLLIGVLGIFLIDEPVTQKEPTKYFENIIYGFLPSTIKQNAKLYIALIAFVVFNISIQIFMPYLIIYYEVSLKMNDYVLVMAPAIVLASVVTFFWGKVYDKKGFTFSIFFSLLWLMLGYLILFIFTDKFLVFIGSLLMMSGYLAGMAVFGATIRDNTPNGKAGRLQGVRIVAQVLIPGVVGPFIGKLVLSGADLIVNSDGTTSFVPSSDIFLAALIAIIIAIPLIILLAKRNKAQQNALEINAETNN